jgi:hypothetical protein
MGFGINQCAACVLDATTSDQWIVSPPSAGVIYCDSRTDTHAGAEVGCALTQIRILEVHKEALIKAELAHEITSDCETAAPDPGRVGHRFG